jgi:hypothetical protein
MGTGKFVFPNGQVPYLEFEMQGKYVSTTDVALLTPTLTTVAPIRAANLAFTWNSITPRVDQVEIDLQNAVSLRPDLSSSAGTSGYFYATITDRDIVANASAEAVLVATNDIYGAWLAGTEAAFSIAIGTGSWNKITFAAPKAQITGPTEGDRDGVLTDDISYDFNRSAANDDEMTITFSV